MKWILNIALLFTCSVVIAQNPEGFEELCEDTLSGTVPTLSVSELKKTKGAESHLIILDAREKNEFKVSHIKNAIHVGFDDFNINALNGLPKDATIVIYCSIGYRSEKIGEKLMDAGYINVRNLSGGIFGWYNAGLPVYDNKERATNSIHGYNLDWSIWVTKERGKIILK